MVDRVLTVFNAFANFSILPEKTSKQCRSPKKARTAERMDDICTPGKGETAAGKADETQQKQRKRPDDESRAFEYGFALIRGGKQSHYGYFEQMVQCECFKELLLKGLILTNNLFLQDTFALEIQAICKAFKNKEYTPTHPHVVLIPFMLQNMVGETLHRGTANCQHFYHLLCAVLRDVPRTNLKRLPLNFHDELLSLATHLKEHEVREYTTKDVDHVVVGLLSVLEALLSKFPAEKAFVGDKCGIVQELLHHCLFEFPNASSQRRMLAAPPPKCKSQPARLAAFSLLCTLARDAPANLETLIAYVKPIHV